MKILVIYPYVPYPLDRGAHHRAFHLLKGLCEENEVAVVRARMPIALPDVDLLEALRAS